MLHSIAMSNSSSGVNSSKTPYIALLIGFLPLIKLHAIPIYVYFVIKSYPKADKALRKIIFLLLSILPFLIFLVRNIYFYRNPFHPYFGNLFPDLFISEQVGSGMGNYFAIWESNRVSLLYQFENLFSQNLKSLDLILVTIFTLLLCSYFAFQLYIKIILKKRVAYFSMFLALYIVFLTFYFIGSLRYLYPFYILFLLLTFSSSSSAEQGNSPPRNKLNPRSTKRRTRYALPGTIMICLLVLFSFNNLKKKDIKLY